MCPTVTYTIIYFHHDCLQTKKWRKNKNASLRFIIFSINAIVLLEIHLSITFILSLLMSATQYSADFELVLKTLSGPLVLIKWISINSKTMYIISQKLNKCCTLHDPWLVYVGRKMPTHGGTSNQASNLTGAKLYSKASLYSSSRAF